MQIAFTLNGRDVSVAAPPAERLSDVLRNRLGLMGTKVGCDAGDCGACTVQIDGDVACACMVAAAQMEGRAVTTIEALASTPTLSRLQEAFLQFGAAQCGICTPGMLMAASALLRDTPRPDRLEVEDALGGVLCRCTGYSKIVDAVMSASDFAGTGDEPAAGAAIGAPIRRLDGVAKVNGTDIFAADEAPEGALVVRVVRSPYHHARFTIGDIDDFLATHPGMVGVLTVKDIPGENCFGVIPPFADQPVFADEVCRFRGEAAAAIVGEAETMAAFDLADFPVTWHELDAVLTPEQALGADAPQLHVGRDNNILITGFVERGDVEKGFAASDIIVEGTSETPFVEHAYIEPEAGFARRVGDRIEISACTQAPHMDRDSMAIIMGLPADQVRIVPTACGGGFGAKLDISLQPYVGLAAWHFKRPARITYTRPESMMSTTKRHPSRISCRIGASKDGRITAFELSGVFNTGAYASWGPTVANRVPVHGSGPYFMANYKAQARAVHTNCAPAGAFRGFGVPQAAIAQETMFDELANKLDIDRLEFRLLNALQNGQPTVTGQVFEKSVGITECLTALQPHWQRARQEAEAFNASGTEHTRAGIGLASCWYGCGNTSLPNPSTIKVGIRQDGSLVLHQGAADIGQGANTVITQICADALGVPVHSFELLSGDTDITPDAGKTSASRQTFVTGKAAMLAGKDLRRQILRHANLSDDAALSLSGGTLVVSDATAQREIRLADLPVREDGYVFVAVETYDPPTAPLDENGQGIPYAVFGYGAQIVELRVDKRFGTVKLVKITAAHDVGRAINPVLVEGQIEGGCAQGIGMALMEEYIPGRTENLHDYLIPTIGDVPPVQSIIVEVADEHGPFGAKGLGEHVLIPTAPAILNAIRHATGASVRQVPATPDRVRKAILEMDTGK